MLEAKPKDPTTTTNFAFEISAGNRRQLSVRLLKAGEVPDVLKKRSIASRKIEKHKARRKTPLIKAARISARCQPYEYFE